MKPNLRGKIPALALISFALIWLSGCMANTGTITHAAVSYFSFVGNTQGAVVSIDEQPAVTSDDGKVATEPGRHRIRVTKGGRLLVDREVLVGDQQTMEIFIP